MRLAPTHAGGQIEHGRLLVGRHGKRDADILARAAQTIKTRATGPRRVQAQRHFLASLVGIPLAIPGDRWEFDPVGPIRPVMVQFRNRQTGEQDADDQDSGRYGDDRMKQMAHRLLHPSRVSSSLLHCNTIEDDHRKPGRYSTVICE
ncbi:MAG: hypothetical protein RID91_03645 [Azospirillaceae bacterium]